MGFQMTKSLVQSTLVDNARPPEKPTLSSCTAVWARLSNVSRALVRSQGGHAGLPFSCCPRLLTRALMLKCSECSFCVACGERRNWALECATAWVCRDAGDVCPKNVLVRDLHIQAPNATHNVRCSSSVQKKIVLVLLLLLQLLFLFCCFCFLVGLVFVVVFLLFFCCRRPLYRVLSVCWPRAARCWLLSTCWWLVLTGRVVGVGVCWCPSAIEDAGQLALAQRGSLAWSTRANLFSDGNGTFLRRHQLKIEVCEMKVSPKSEAPVLTSLTTKSANIFWLNRHTSTSSNRFLLLVPSTSSLQTA